MISETLEGIFGTRVPFLTSPELATTAPTYLLKTNQTERYPTGQLAKGGGIPNTTPKTIPYSLVIKQPAEDGDYSAMAEAADKDARDEQATLTATFRPSNVYLFLRSDKEFEMEEIIERLAKKLAGAREAQQAAFLASRGLTPTETAQVLQERRVEAAAQALETQHTQLPRVTPVRLPTARAAVLRRAAADDDEDEMAAAQPPTIPPPPPPPPPAATAAPVPVARTAAPAAAAAAAQRVAAAEAAAYMPAQNRPTLLGPFTFKEESKPPGPPTVPLRIRRPKAAVISVEQGGPAPVAVAAMPPVPHPVWLLDEDDEDMPRIFPDEEMAPARSRGTWTERPTPARKAKPTVDMAMTAARRHTNTKGLRIEWRALRSKILRTPMAPAITVAEPDSEPPRPRAAAATAAAAAAATRTAVKAATTAAAAGAGGGTVPVMKAEVAGVNWRKSGVSAAERAFKEDMVAESIARRSGAPVEEAKPKTKRR